MPVPVVIYSRPTLVKHRQYQDKNKIKIQLSEMRCLRGILGCTISDRKHSCIRKALNVTSLYETIIWTDVAICEKYLRTEYQWQHQNAYLREGVMQVGWGNSGYQTKLGEPNPWTWRRKYHYFLERATVTILESADFSLHLRNFLNAKHTHIEYLHSSFLNGV